MDEFKRFSFSRVNDLKSGFTTKEVPFESELGPFNYHQDRTIRFGRSKVVVIFTLLLSLSILLSASSVLNLILSTSVEGIDDISKVLFWAKVVAVIGLMIQVLPVLGTGLICISSRKANIKGILIGLNVFSLFIVILYILFAIAVLFFGYILLKLLFQAFLIVVLIGAIIIGVLYLCYVILSELLHFNNSLRAMIDPSEIEKANPIPNAGKLKACLKILLFFVVIGSIISLFDLEQVPTFVGPFSSFIDSVVYRITSIILSLSTFVMFIYLLGEFDEFFRDSYKHIVKPVKKQRHYYDGYEEVE